MLLASVNRIRKLPPLIESRQGDETSAPEIRDAPGDSLRGIFPFPFYFLTRKVKGAPSAFQRHAVSPALTDQVVIAYDQRFITASSELGGSGSIAAPPPQIDPSCSFLLRAGQHFSPSTSTARKLQSICCKSHFLLVIFFFFTIFFSIWADLHLHACVSFFGKCKLV